MNALQNILIEHYSIQPTNITLFREMIGAVYKIDTATTSYIFKVYKHDQKDLVKRTLFAMERLKNTTVSIPRIHQTNKHKQFLCFHDSFDYIGLLFDYIEGHPPAKNTNQIEIANILQSLHEEMDNVSYLDKYSLGQDFYVGRFIELLKQKQYHLNKITKLQKIGEELYRVFHQYPLSFCHGDFHNENMIISKDQIIYLFDFDASNYTNNIIDIATYCDQSDFNAYDEKDLLKTKSFIQQFMLHYHPTSNQKIPLKDIMSFIPLRHMELIATIASVKGSNTITTAFLDQQYNWIISYYNTLKQATF